MMKSSFASCLLVLLVTACTAKPEKMTPAPVPSSPAPSSDWWNPSPGLTWQWQLTDLPVDTNVDAQVYDIDLFDNDAGVIADLHSRGHKVICYISVGSWEDWRPDKDQFPPTVLGKKYEGWPGEKWLDIRRTDLLAPILRARLDLCATKGFDAVEPDNIQIADNNTGFPIAYADQLTYARWLADEAHARGLAIGLKNAPEMVADARSFFDFAITEDCFQQGWCEKMLPFVQNGKPVFAAEYTDTGVDFKTACRWGSEHQVSFILKDRNLSGFRETCAGASHP